MAKFRILSDLHLEFRDWDPPAAECDGVLLCGDIHGGDRGLEWARRAFGDLPVAYVFGNHEWYGQKFPKYLDRYRKRASELGIALLERESAQIAGVRILGATMWTDFDLGGNSSLARWDAKSAMTDYKKITWNRPGSDSYRKLRPEDVLSEHLASREWLARELEKPFEGKTAVITHHAPCSLSLGEPQRGFSHLDPCYASRLEERFFGEKVALWAHGHTHLGVDYELYGTRVVSNPKGYPMEPAPGFDPGLVVEI